MNSEVKAVKLTASCTESLDASNLGRLRVFRGDKCSKRRFAPLAKFPSRFKTCPGCLGMRGRLRRADEANTSIKLNWLYLGISSLKIAPFKQIFVQINYSNFNKQNVGTRFPFTLFMEL